MKPPLTEPTAGLVVHRPDARDKPPTPRYTLVRLSATATTGDWFHTNEPEPEPEPGAAPRLPQWAEYVRAQATRVVPRLAAMQGVVDSDSESEDMEDEYQLDAPRRPMSRARPHRFRIWGLAASPAGACSAVVVTKHSTHHPHRRARSKLLFAWPDAPPPGGPPPPPPPAGLTTEGRLWEAIYGCRGSVADTVPTAGAPALPSPLRDLFRAVVSLQRCVFCDAPLRAAFNESACENGHLFGQFGPTSFSSLSPALPPFPSSHPSAPADLFPFSGESQPPAPPRASPSWPPACPASAPSAACAASRSPSSPPSPAASSGPTPSSIRPATCAAAAAASLSPRSSAPIPCSRCWASSSWRLACAWRGFKGAFSLKIYSPHVRASADTASSKAPSRHVPGQSESFGVLFHHSDYV